MGEEGIHQKIYKARPEEADLKTHPKLKPLPVLGDPGQPLALAGRRP